MAVTRKPNMLEEQFLTVLNKALSLNYLIYLSRFLDQETAKGPSRYSSQSATCYYQSNHSMVGAISLAYYQNVMHYSDYRGISIEYDA